MPTLWQPAFSTSRSVPFGAFAMNAMKLHFNATDIVCFGDFMEWCCEGVSSFPNSGMSQPYESIRVPIDSTWNHD
jgi:hypothetical protein